MKKLILCIFIFAILLQQQLILAGNSLTEDQLDYSAIANNEEASVWVDEGLNDTGANNEDHWNTEAECELSNLEKECEVSIEEEEAQEGEESVEEEEEAQEGEESVEEEEVQEGQESVEEEEAQQGEEEEAQEEEESVEEEAHEESTTTNTNADEFWDIIDPSNLDNDSNLQNALNLGVQFVIQRGVENGLLLPNTMYHAAQINLIQESPDGSKVYFNVLLEPVQNDPPGDGVVATFEVTNTPQGQEVTYYAFLNTLFEGGSTPAGLQWTKSYTLDEYNNDQNLQNQFENGLNYVVGVGADAGAFPSSSGFNSHIWGVASGNVDGNDYYLYNADVWFNDRGDSFEVFFVVSNDNVVSYIGYGTILESPEGYYNEEGPN